MKKLELNFAAIDFARANLDETDLLKLDAATLAAATELKLSDPDYRQFKQMAGNHRNQFLGLKRQDDQAVAQAKRQAPAKG